SRPPAGADGRFQRHAGLGEIAGPRLRSGQSRRAHFQFFISPWLAQGRERQRGRLRIRWPQPPQSRPRGALQDPHGRRRSGDRLSQPAGERASIARWCPVAGGFQHQQLSAARLQEFDGFLWLHRWPASLRLPRRAIGETVARQERPGNLRPPPRTGKTRQAKIAPMKAMILAAGLGTRLRPLTDNRPKALVELSGRTLLEITRSSLRAFGVTEFVVNVHHFADMVIEYLKSNNNFGMRIEISREDVLLDTGGGLKKVAWFFLENSAPRHSKSGDSNQMD